jgi:RNA polymerase sigma-70 factor (sigma-E family)
LNADTSEFAQFIKARSHALQRTAWLLTGDWGMAEDLVQTALARSWPRWERINRRDDPEVYVRRVMINTWRTWSRRRWRGEKATPDVEPDAVVNDVASEVATRMYLRDLLATLSGRQRAVLVLRLYDDLPEAQVAEMLSCSTGTVKSTLSRALARLRQDPHLAEFMEREKQ